MAQLIKAKINVKKIDKLKLFIGKSGVYLDVDIWINDTPDNYGNICSIQQQTGKDEQKIYLGNGKIFEFKKPEPEPEKAEPKVEPKKEEEDGDLPF